MSQATDMLAAYQSAELAIVSGSQEYMLGDKRVTKADLGMIQRGRDYWQRQVNAELGTASGDAGGSLGIRRATFGC